MGTFRQVEADERARHQAIKDHVWGEGGLPDYDGPDDVPASLGERWAYVVDGEFVAICTLMTPEVRLAGEWRPVGGIRGFVTPPEYRGRGYGPQLLEAAIAEFDDRGLTYSLLWPESIAYYRRHGWGLVNTETAYTFPPEAMADPGRSGTIERVGVDDLDRLEAVYTAYASEYELAFRRTARWWRERVLADAWTYCYMPADGNEAEGYVVYTIDRDAATLSVAELVAVTARARRQLLAFLDRHEPQVETVEWSCPDERRLLTEAADPDAVAASIEPGGMGRLVDVATAIASLPADRAPTATVTIGVSDPLVAVNDAVFRVEPDLSCARVEADPAVTVDVSVLSRLFAGPLSIQTAVAREAVTASDGALAALEPVFQRRDVYVSDFF